MDMPSSGVSVIHEQEGIATVSLERPPHNFIDASALTALADALSDLDVNESCRAIILRSEGTSFCAGAVVGKADKSAPVSEGPSAFYDAAVRLYGARKPIIVAIQGATIGAGLGLALVGDFRIASTKARFATNFVKLGFHPGFGLSATLPRMIGVQNAARMLLGGQRIDAELALSYGLVDEIAAPETVYSEAIKLARQIAENAPLAVVATRATLRAGLAEMVRVQAEHELSEQRRLMATEDFSEGVRAVSERRPGNFVGR